MKNFYIILSAAPGNAKTNTYTVMKNGTATGVACSVTGAATTTCNDTTNTASVVAGDELGIKAATASGNTAAKTSWAFEITFP